MDDSGLSVAAHYSDRARADEAEKRGFCCTIGPLCYNASMVARDAWPVLRVLVLMGIIGLTLDPRPTAAQTGEPTPVADLREYPDRYHLHQVLLQGRARDVRAFDPYKIPAGTVCYGAYSFLLEDETGTMPVIVMGVCGVPVVKDPDVDDGDTVAVQVTVHEPGKGTFFLTLDGRRIPFSDTDAVQGVATNLWTLAKASADHPHADDADPPPVP